MTAAVCSEADGVHILEVAMRAARRAVRRGRLPERELEEARGAAVVRLVEEVGRFDPARGTLDAFLWTVARHEISDYVRQFHRRRWLRKSDRAECGREIEERWRCCTFCPFEDPGFERERETRATLKRVDEILEASPPRIAAACYQLLAECGGTSDVPPMSRSKKSRIRGACATLFLTRRMDSSPTGTDERLQAYSA